MLNGESKLEERITLRSKKDAMQLLQWSISFFDGYSENGDYGEEIPYRVRDMKQALRYLKSH